MVNRQVPPGRKSMPWVIVVNPRGPYQWIRCLGSVQTANTSSRGASNTRVKTSSRSVVSAARSGVVVIGLLLLGLEVVEVLGQPVEALGPEPLVGLDPVVDRLEPVRVELVEPLRPVAADG